MGKLGRQQSRRFGQDRPALSMIRQAEGARRNPARRCADRGDQRQYRHRVGDDRGGEGLPLEIDHAENQSAERRRCTNGAELILGEREEGMEGARDLAARLERKGRAGARPVRQPRQPAGALRNHRSRNLARHGGRVTHFVSAMGPPVPSWGCRAISRNGTNPQIQNRPVAADRGVLHCRHPSWPLEHLPKVLTRRGWIEPGCRSGGKPRRSPAGWPARKASVVGIGGGAVAVALTGAGGRECGDRHHHLRPRRPLPSTGLFSD